MHAADKIGDDEMKEIMKENTESAMTSCLTCSPHGADIIDDLTRCPNGTTRKFVSTDPCSSCFVINNGFVEIGEG